MTRRALRTLILLAAALAAVALLDAITPSLAARGRGWDSEHYLDMAERGMAGNERLVAPFAYRPVGPLLARALAHALLVSVDGAFRALTWAGTAAQLGFAFALARLVAPAAAAMVVAAAVALSLFNARFLLLDVYRPDALALPLALAATWAVLAGRPVLGALLAGPGLIVREFLLAPLAAALDALIRRPRPLHPATPPRASDQGTRAIPRHEDLAAGDRARDSAAAAPRPDHESERELTRRQRLATAAVALVLAAAATALPRVLIPVARDVAATSPFRGDLLATLLATPLSLPRDLNLIFCVASYALPVLVLAGRGRLRGAWAALGERRRPLIVVAAVTLLLALYGGTDLPRFVAYLAGVQCVVLAAMLARGVARAEIAVMLAAVAIFNRLHVTVLPADMEAMLDVYAGYGDRVNAATAWRIAELAAWVAAVRLVRRGVEWRGRHPGPHALTGRPGAS